MVQPRAYIRDFLKLSQCVEKNWELKRRIKKANS